MVCPKLWKDVLEHWIIMLSSSPCRLWQVLRVLQQNILTAHKGEPEAETMLNLTALRKNIVLLRQHHPSTLEPQWKENYTVILTITLRPSWTGLNHGFTCPTLRRHQPKRTTGRWSHCREKNRNWNFIWSEDYWEPPSNATVISDDGLVPDTGRTGNVDPFKLKNREGGGPDEHHHKTNKVPPGHVPAGQGHRHRTGRQAKRHHYSHKP